MGEIISVQNCSYKYEDGTEALKNISFSVQKGEKVAFLGGNGAGKSTLFLCMNGILRPTKGKILLEGKPIVYNRRGLLAHRSNVGIVFQEPDNQLFSASVYQEISFGILNMGIEKEQARILVEEIIEELEIAPFQKKPVHCLSGGQKKQVAIADVLVMSPNVILLDEPASALDPRHTKLVRCFIDRMVDKGMTVFVSTHDMDYAYEWADRIIIFKNGEQMAEGKPKELFVQKELIESCNLLQPTVVKLFQSLCEHGILTEEKEIPTTMEDLEQYLILEKENYNGRKRNFSC